MYMPDELRQIVAMRNPQRQMAMDSTGISISKLCAHTSYLTVVRDTEGRHAASSSASPTPFMPFRITSAKHSCARCTTLLVLIR